jgi:uncharacterized protein
MRSIRYILSAAFAALIVSCAGQADHFYALSTLPNGVRPPATAFATHVILTVSVPSVVDRRQMVINTSGDGVLILEHERWAAPMSQLVSETLARDLEQRRADVLVGDRGFDQSAAQTVKIRVDVVQMSARKDGLAILEAHWRIVDAAAKTDEIGGEVFTAPLGGEGYAAVAQGFSACLSSLAERVAEKLPAH